MKQAKSATAWTIPYFHRSWSNIIVLTLKSFLVAWKLINPVVQTMYE